jgi:tRNA (guanine37-N1)-methyltransferase
LQNFLSLVLSPEDLANVYNSYDIVGDIAIFKLPCASRQNARNIAKTIISVHKNVKTVLAQVSPVAGDFRLRRLAHVSGENRTSTIHSESGCLFSVDVDKCYFSPRLYYERSRIARLVKSNEAVVNMFAGVGCFSIIIAKHANTAKVFSIDVNPTAIQFMHENIMLNRVYGNVIPLLGDAKAIIERRLQHVADRVLMPLPEKAFEYLPYALSALKTSGGWIHYYDFEHAEKTENPVEKTKLKVAEKLSSLNVAFEFPFSRVVRTTGPNWYQVVLDIHVARFPDKF